MPVWIQIDAYDPATAAAVSLCAGNMDEVAVCMAAGGPWWPMIAKAPVLRYDLFDGAFGGDITAPTTSFTLQVEAWPNFGRYAIADARVQVWTDITAAPVFDGRATAQPKLSGGQAEIDIKVDDGWLDKPLLATYAGTTGLEGPAGLKGQPKPLALGAPRYIAGKLIDSVNNVFQVSAYGAVQGFEAALERLARFGAPVADYASYAALVAASIPAGAWATCTAQGLARFGAPTTGQVSFLVQGDTGGPDGWARKPGQLIRRLALLSGGSGKVHDASLNALDAARPYNLSIYLDQQTTARQLIQSIAASVNAVAGVSWTGKLFVVPVALGAATMTLAADGTALPPVRSIEQMEVAAPFAKIAIEAERAWTVHQLADIAFVDPLIDMGVYNNGSYYRPGNIVQWAGATWRYKTGAAPGSGNPPPTPPTTSNTWWTVLAQQGAAGASGANAINNINRLRNTQFEQGLRGWTTPLVSSVTIDPGYPLTGIASGYRYYRVWFTASASGGAVSIGNDYSGGYEVPVTPLEFLSVQTAVELQGPANLKLVIWWIDGTGSASPTDVAVATGSQPLGSIIGSVVQVPAGYTRARIELYATATAAGHISLIMSRPMVASATSGQTALPPFTPGTADAADGAAGINTATINIFQRASTAPALPTTTVTYNFATASTTGLNNGWSTTIPAGSDPLWQSAATAVSQSATDTIAPSEWASAVQIAANGSSAASSAPVLLYNRTTTPSAPAVPSTTVSYDFATAVATGVNNGWSQSLPATGGAYRWQINATAVSTTTTDTIAPSEWSAPNIMAQDGTNGSPGTSTAQLTIYQRAASAPALPSVSATYDFAAKTLSGLSGGWSPTIPAGTDPVYTAQALASSTGATASIAPGDWSTPVKAIQNGQDSTTARASLSVTDDGVPVTGSAEVTIATATITLTSGGKLKVSGGIFDAVGSNDNVPGGSTQISTAGMRLKVAGTTIASGALTITADGIVTADPIVGWSGQLLAYSASGSVTVSLTRQRSGPSASGGATYSINLLLEAVT